MPYVPIVSMTCGEILSLIRKAINDVSDPPLHERALYLAHANQAYTEVCAKGKTAPRTFTWSAVALTYEYSKAVYLRNCVAIESVIVNNSSLERVGIDQVFREYGDTWESTSSAYPEVWSVRGPNIVLCPAPATASTIRIEGYKTPVRGDNVTATAGDGGSTCPILPTMVLDTDYPEVPSTYEHMLWAGPAAFFARVHGMDPLAQNYQQMYDQGLAELTAGMGRLDPGDSWTTIEEL